MPIDGHALADLYGGADAFVGVGRRHADVDDCEIRLDPVDGVEQLDRVAHRGTTSRPASLNNRVSPARRSTESSAITMRMATPREQTLARPSD